MSREARRLSQKATKRTRSGTPARAGGRGLNLPLIPIAAAIALVAVIALLVYAVLQIGKDGSTPGQGGDHMNVGETRPICAADAADTSTCYNSNPPTSGRHAPQALQWGIYSEPVPQENLIHNMEHGGVTIWYNCDDGCKEVVDDLTDLVNKERDGGNALLLTAPYPEVEPDTVAITSWTRLDTEPALVRLTKEMVKGS